RLADWDAYGRAISLATLGSGQVWSADPTLPLLTPIYFLSGLTAPEIIAASHAILGALLVLAVGFSAGHFAGNRRAARIAAWIAASGAAMLAVAEGASDRMEWALLFGLVAVTFAREQRTTALMAGTTALLIATSIHDWTSVGVLLLYACCV